MTTFLAILAVVGTLAGAIGGPWLQTRSAARHARDARFEDRRIELYTQAILHTETRERLIEHITGASGSDAAPELPEPDHEAAVTAQLRLLAPEPVLEAW